MATESGVSPQTISNLLRGHLHGQPNKPWRPRVANLRAVVQALRAAGCDIPEVEWLRLAGFEPGEYLAIQGDPAAVSPEYLATQIKALNPTERAAVDTLVSSILRARGYIQSDSPPSVSTGREPGKSGVASHGEPAEQETPSTGD